MADETTKTNSVLTRDQILASSDIGTAELYVPEWNGTIRVRGLSLREVDSIIKLSTRRGNLNVMQSALFTFVRGVVEPKFTDEDIDDLKNKSALVLQVVKEINRLSGVTDLGDDTAIELAEKN